MKGINSRLKVFGVFIALMAYGSLHAQKLTVDEMKAAPMDLSASQYERKDLSGQPCGLVKVQLAAVDAQFEGNVIGKTEYKTGEYWVYMTEGSYMLSVKHPQFVPLHVNFRNYGINGVESKVTYVLTLLMPNVQNGNEMTLNVNGVSFNMIRVEGGTFEMGERDNEYSKSHQVTLSDYYIGETEVTQELWYTVMGKNPSAFKGLNYPVESVSWNDCQKFISRLNDKTGCNFRLPTEAEWEFAARGGVKSKSLKYSGSSTAENVAWFKENSEGNIHPVKTMQANELGVYDMSGNVWEWCQDWYSPHYESEAQSNPFGPQKGVSRVFRGGSIDCGVDDCRPTVRGNFAPKYQFEDVGLRLALKPY